MPALTAKRYKSRPSPPFHAGDYKGETKPGNDGKTYVSKADSRGVYRWVLVAGTRKRTTKKKSKVSKRVQAMMDDPANPLGKNPKLEAFWRSLASSEKVVLIYKDGSQKFYTMPSMETKKFKNTFDSFEQDPTIVAVITSAMSWDAYESQLYPKAKDKTVEEVLGSWRSYFKSLDNGSKLYVTY